MSLKKPNDEQYLEFGGAIGATLLVFGLPAAIIAINLACNTDECTLLHLPVLPAWSELFDIHAVFIYIGWFVWQLFLAALPLGTLVYGLPLKCGKRLQYRCNGFIAFILSVMVFLLMVFIGVPMQLIYQKFLALAAMSIIFSFVLALFLYCKSLHADSDTLAEGGNTGIFIYDFFLGRELNPRVGPIDLKFFCELRPGLIGWIVLDLSFIAECVANEQFPSAALLLVTAFHALYVADALYHEEAILTTMDIVHDGFGLMLALGDLAWVPFLYSLQARFLLEHPQNWSMIFLIGILTLNSVGYVIFRSSNSQKNAFRQNPELAEKKQLKTMATESGRKLLISGWWGWLRHPNYFGDLIMASSWSLLTGFEHILPYFYPVYFAGLLVHRSQRDDHHCRAKYQHDWDRYCRIVPYRIVPYLY